jgi:ABC-2 family transporter protein
VRWLLIKDLQILRRSPVLVGTLVIYPLVIALLIGFAISSPPGKPKVAIYSAVKPGHGKVMLGNQQVNLSKYAGEFYKSVQPIHADTPAEAIADVRSGRALAALIIPPDIDRQIQSLISTGVGNPTIRIVVNDKNPLDRDLVQEAVQTRLDQVQSAVSKQVLNTVMGDLQKVLSGGKLSFLGRNVNLLGLKNTRSVVASAVASLGPHSHLTPALQQVVNFADIAISGLALASPEISGVGTPLTVKQTALTGKTTPTASYAIAIAIVFLVMFVALVLAAGTLALERAENAYRRLVRGLVSPLQLLTEKVLLAGLCGALLTLVMAALISIFVPLDWGRLELWVIALLAAGASFGALGVLVGAGARDVGIASLLAFLVSLPIAFIALVPHVSVAAGIGQLLSVISFLFPFAPALDAVSTGFTGSGPEIWLPLLHLVVEGVIYLALARIALRRFAAR